ncbi:MAG TPA: hypothetical protein VM823_02025 [Gaiellales bacterium]|nr:hypothetical protein [Gaiellales bacterium]
MLAMVVAGCSFHGSTHGSGGNIRPAAGAERAEHNGLIYAAVLRQLIEVDHGFGRAPSPYRHVYILDGPVAGAGNPMHAMGVPRHAFGAGVKRQISHHVEGLPPVDFVRTQPVHVPGRAVFVRLGPVRWVNDSTVHVSNSRWAHGRDGLWVTYVVRLGPAGWHVTAIVGPVALS